MAISFRSVVNKPLARYAFAVVTVVASFLFRFALVRYFGLEFPPFMTFFPAVIFVAILAGFWPGMLASALIVSGIVFLLLPPIGSFSIAAPRDAIAVAMFAVISIFLNLLVERFRRSERLISSYKEEQASEKSEEDKRRLAETVQHERDTLSALINTMNDEVWFIDTNQEFVFLNSAASNRFGFESAMKVDIRELDKNIELRSPDGSIRPIRESPPFRALRGETIRNEEEILRVHAKGESWSREINSAPLRDAAGNITGALAVVHDITGHKRAEARIQQLNRVYATLSHINQAIIRENDTKTMLEAVCHIAVNQGQFRMAWIGMTDTSTQRLKSVAFSGVVDGYLDQVKIDLHEPDPTAGPVARCIQTGTHSICNDIEHELLRPWRSDAIEKGYRSVAAFPLRCEETLIGVFTLYASEPAFFDGDEAQLLDELAADISLALTVNRLEENRKKAEAELRWQTAFLRAQVDSSLDGVLVVGVDGKKILQNKRMNEMLKIPPHISEDPNDTPQLTFVTQMMKNPEQFLEKVTYLAAHPEIVGRDELELVDGSILERYSYPVMDVAGSNFGRIWTFRDITERRQLEDHFRQVQKMEAIGQLTGGIAHDFNNLLAVIIGNLDLLERQINDNEPAVKRVRTARNASFRGTNLTRRLLAFARRETLQPKEIDLNAIIGIVLELATPALGPKIQVVTRLDPSTPAVFADASGLENALLNLVVNARDAMMKGGTLTITSEVRNLDSGQHSGIESELRPGGYAYVTVSDTGQGMTKEIAEKVFEPFFTTKSHGTGLGLAMVWGFIKQSSGTVQVDSEPGCGTTFSFFLPLAEEVVKLHSAPILEAQSQDAAGSTILVVDDEDGLLEIASSCLGELGYTILTAGDGTSAKRLIEERDDIALLLTDIIMPGEMSGVELAEYAIQIKPCMRIIYCSGFPAGALAERDIIVAEDSLLRKPYQRSDLISIVRKALESVPAGAKARNSASNTTS
jgi:PAS domain S-box-containing protein